MMNPETKSRQNLGSSLSHSMCKAVVAMIILEGLICNGTKSPLIFGGVDGASSVRHPGQTTFGKEDSVRSSFGGGINMARGETTKRMRDRCGRFSLLRVLQQWENLQKRCRLSLRDNLQNEERDRYEYIMSGSSPPSPDDIDDLSIGKRSRHHFYSHSHKNEKPEEENEDIENRFQNNYYEVNGDALDSCCPVIFEVIAPVYGRMARTGHMVELYKDENVQQKFYEYRCHKDYLDQSCKYVDNQHRKISKCVQQYLDTYALVRSEKSATGWSMENIRIASGCACKVDPKKRAGRRRKKISQSQRNHDFFGSPLRQRNSKPKRREQLQQFRSSIIDY